MQDLEWLILCIKKGHGLTVRHDLCTEEGHGLLVQAWSMYITQSSTVALFFSWGMVTLVKIKSYAIFIFSSV